MARIAGVEVSDGKRIEFGLASIYGIGRPTARKIINELKLDANRKIGELTTSELNELRGYIENNLAVEGELRQQIFRNIKRLKDIRCYRGIRHKLGLPVRGQRTRCNARTRKGKGMAVGGLNRAPGKK